MMKKLCIMLIGMFSFIILVNGNAYAYDVTDPMKNNLNLWINDEVTTDIFFFEVELLIENNIIDVAEKTIPDDDKYNKVPFWIKESTRFWIDGLTSNEEFFSMLEYSIQNNLFTLPQNYLDISNVVDLAIKHTGINNHQYAIGMLSLTHQLDPHTTYELIQSEISLNKFGYFDKTKNRITINDMQTNLSQNNYDLETVDNILVEQNNFVWYHLYPIDEVINPLVESDGERFGEAGLEELEVMILGYAEDKSGEVTNLVFENLESGGTLNDKQIKSMLKLLKKISKIDPDIAAKFFLTSGNELNKYGIQREGEHYCNTIIENMLVSDPTKFEETLETLDPVQRNVFCQDILRKFDSSYSVLPESITQIFYSAIIMYNFSLILNNDDGTAAQGLSVSLDTIGELESAKTMSHVALSMGDSPPPTAILNVALGLREMPYAQMIMYDYLLESSPGHLRSILHLDHHFSCHGSDFESKLLLNYAFASNPGMRGLIEQEKITLDELC